MSKRPNAADGIKLAIELLKRIPKSYKVTAQELHKQLEDIGISRDIRSIQRNLDMLCENFDIEKDDRAKPFGYSWKKGSSGLSLSNLSAQEALLLSLAEEYLANLLPRNLMASMDGFFVQARKQLQLDGNNGQEKQWLKKVKVVSENFQLLPPHIDQDVFKLVTQALYENRLLNIDYYNAKREEKSAMVKPLGLAQQGPKLYMVCRFDGYENERSIALHRINKAVVSSFTFERPKEFKLDQYDKDARFGFGEGERIKLEFFITKPAGYHLFETPISEDQDIQEFDEHFKVTATVVKSKHLQVWLDGFGELVWGVECD